MRKLILTLVAVAFVGFVQAQSFRFSAGYGIPWISQQIGTETSTLYTPSSDPTQVPRIIYNSKNVKGSYGSGWNIGGAYIYEMSKNVSLELGLSYLQGKKYTTQSAYTEMAGDVVRNSSFESETSSSKSFLFTPALKFSPNKKRRRREVSPYFLAGPVLGKVNFDKELKSSEQTNSNVKTENRTTKFRGGISLGVRAGFGVSVVMNRRFSLFSEVMFTGMNYYPKESEITRYVVNGEDNLSTLTENVRKTIYVNELTMDSQQNANAVNSPGRSLRFPVAMSSISANVGVIIKPQ
jgi:hypothetical protein